MPNKLPSCWATFMSRRCSATRDKESYLAIVSVATGIFVPLNWTRGYTLV
jgi:hypothetical protein